MESSWPENLLSNRSKAIQKLRQRCELTNQLRAMMPGKSVIGYDGLVSVDDLVVKIFGTFAETLSILKNSASQIPASVGAKSEDSGESSKTSAALKPHRRGCYKRRKISETDSTIKVTSTLIDDGYAWRKYGQKEILNAKHRRNYYRCTHKFDKRCQATKQVQKTEDEPPSYRTTYHGHHTCRKLLKSPQIIFDSTSYRDSLILLSFESNGLLAKKPDEIPYFPTIMQQEFKEDFPCLKHNQSPPSDYLLLSPNLTSFDPSGPLPVLSSGSDHGDVISSGLYSCTSSTHSFEMDMMMAGSVDFDDFEF